MYLQITRCIFFLNFFLIFNVVFAQSNLPPCAGIITNWNYCFGKNLLPNGDTYSGEWVAAKPSGQGVLISSNGKNKYVGKFLDGAFHGYGLMEFESGGKHVGYWKSGKPDGEGTRTWADGKKYIGNWTSGAMNGKGSLNYPDGNTYVGEFKDGKRNGQGSYSNFGSAIHGVWLNDKYISNELQSISSNTISNELNKIDQERKALLLEKTELELEKKRLSERKNSPANIIEINRYKPQQSVTENDLSKRKQNIFIDQVRMEAAKHRLGEGRESEAYAITFVSRKALIIGNDNYTSIKKLENAREDAKTIATNLTALGYQVTLKLDLNEKEMKAALRIFVSQIQGGDEVMFFFAGHGVQLGAANYLLPTDIVGDSEAQVRDEAIQLQRVLEDISESKAKFTLAVIDACRDNPLKQAEELLAVGGLRPQLLQLGK